MSLGTQSSASGTFAAPSCRGSPPGASHVDCPSCPRHGSSADAKYTQVREDGSASGVEGREPDGVGGSTGPEQAGGLQAATEAPQVASEPTPASEAGERRRPGGGPAGAGRLDRAAPPRTAEPEVGEPERGGAPDAGPDGGGGGGPRGPAPGQPPSAAHVQPRSDTLAMPAESWPMTPAAVVARAWASMSAARDDATTASPLATAAGVHTGTTTAAAERPTLRAGPAAGGTGATARGWVGSTAASPALPWPRPRRPRRRRPEAPPTGTGAPAAAAGTGGVGGGIGSGGSSPSRDPDAGAATVLARPARGEGVARGGGAGPGTEAATPTPPTTEDGRGGREGASRAVSAAGARASGAEPRAQTARGDGEGAGAEAAAPTPPETEIGRGGREGASIAPPTARESRAQAARDDGAEAGAEAAAPATAKGGGNGGCATRRGPDRTPTEATPVAKGANKGRTPAAGARRRCRRRASRARTQWSSPSPHGRVRLPASTPVTSTSNSRQATHPRAGRRRMSAAPPRKGTGRRNGGPSRSSRAGVNTSNKKRSNSNRQCRPGAVQFCNNVFY